MLTQYTIRSHDTGRVIVELQTYRKWSPDVQTLPLLTTYNHPYHGALWAASLCSRRFASEWLRAARQFPQTYTLERRVRES